MDGGPASDTLVQVASWVALSGEFREVALECFGVSGPVVGADEREGCGVVADALGEGVELVEVVAGPVGCERCCCGWV